MILHNNNQWFLELRQELEPWELDEFHNLEKTKSAFSGDLEFGTGGIRCLMGVGPNRMNRITIGKATQGLANWLSLGGESNLSVAIGYDTRIHSKEFASITACVLAANGIRVNLFASPQPTPVLDYAVRKLGCVAGVCITASHNPREYNGYKVYDADGVQATDEMALAIQECIKQVDAFKDVKTVDLATAVRNGSVSYINDVLLIEYYEAVLSNRLGIDCSSLDVVYSPLNGTGAEPATRIMRNLGVKLSRVVEQFEPDGNFPSCPKPNPENAETMAMGMRQMIAEEADLFLANDPDADRVGVACLHNGEATLLSGNDIALLLFDFMSCHCDKLKHQTAVTTIVTAPLADEIALANGIELRRTLTGFKYIGEQIGLIRAKNDNYLIGFEESDGYLAGDYVRDKDGICGVMLVCEVASYYKALGMSLVDALESLYQRYGYALGRQLTIDLDESVDAKAVLSVINKLPVESIQAALDLRVVSMTDYSRGTPMPVIGGNGQRRLPPSPVIEWRLVDGSRVFIRPSGTEPKLKAYVFVITETQEKARTSIERLSARVSSVLRSALTKEC